MSAYRAIGFETGLGGIDTIRSDGSGLTALSFTGLTQVYSPAYAVDGTNRIAFIASTASGIELCTGPATGRTPTVIQDGSRLRAGEGISTLGVERRPESM